MENIAIQTSQNIAIEQRVASIGERIAATAIDMVILFTYLIVVSVALNMNKALLMFFLLMLPCFFYHLICETAMNGQSWGKKIMKIKVVMADGSQSTFITYLIRWIFRLIDVSLSFGAVSTITIIVNGKGQRVGDIAAGTTVISLKERSHGTEIFTTLPDNYNLHFPQASKLNDKDISVASEVLDYIKETQNSKESRVMALKARNALETKMGIKTDLGDERFLKTIIYDYNFIHSR